MNSLAELQSRIGYRFSDESRLQRALTHRSFGNENNERLEFLGDAVLGMVIADVLFHREGRLAEGDLSRLRASLVNRDSLAELAGALELDTILRLGGGEMKSGGARRSSVLADAFEAIIGAIYIDGGFEAADRFVREQFTDRLAALPDAEELKDPKTRLQEFLQSRGEVLPIYELVSSSGPAHKREFVVSCRVDSLGLETNATGRSRRRAEQAAAAKLLESMHG
ncbi:MAG: ribonuclease III [Gammaproteobacteria bacterium]|nr:ribonuclease III [Gammaproteobacteria bacterium]